MHRAKFFNSSPTNNTSKNHNMTETEDMIKALAALELCDVPNYSAIAKEYRVRRTTLMRRHKGQTRPRADFLSESVQCLTNEQEEVLIKHINRMTERGMPPTSQIVKNLAEEIIGKPVGKNWTGQFVHRYNDRLKSLYLRNIDKQRVKSEYGPLYEHFFQLVEFNFINPLLCNY